MITRARIPIVIVRSGAIAKTIATRKLTIEGSTCIGLLLSGERTDRYAPACLYDPAHRPCWASEGCNASKLVWCRWYITACTNGQSRDAQDPVYRARVQVAATVHKM